MKKIYSFFDFNEFDRKKDVIVNNFELFSSVLTNEKDMGDFISIVLKSCIK